MPTRVTVTFVVRSESEIKALLADISRRIVEGRCDSGRVFSQDGHGIGDFSLEEVE